MEHTLQSSPLARSLNRDSIKDVLSQDDTLQRLRNRAHPWEESDTELGPITPPGTPRHEVLDDVEKDLELRISRSVALKSAIKNRTLYIQMRKVLTLRKRKQELKQQELKQQELEARAIRYARQVKNNPSPMNLPQYRDAIGCEDWKGQPPQTKPSSRSSRILPLVPGLQSFKKERRASQNDVKGQREHTIPWFIRPEIEQSKAAHGSDLLPEALPGESMPKATFPNPRRMPPWQDSIAFNGPYDAETLSWNSDNTVEYCSGPLKLAFLPGSRAYRTFISKQGFTLSISPTCKGFLSDGKTEIAVTLEQCSWMRKRALERFVSPSPESQLTGTTLCADQESVLCDGPAMADSDGVSVHEGTTAQLSGAENVHTLHSQGQCKQEGTQYTAESEFTMPQKKSDTAGVESRSSTARQERETKVDSGVVRAGSAYSVRHYTNLKNSHVRFVECLASSFARDVELEPAQVRAILDPAIGRERYERNIRRLLAQCGWAMKVEATDMAQMYVARLLCSRGGSFIAARAIALQAERMATKHMNSTTPNLMEGNSQQGAARTSKTDGGNNISPQLKPADGLQRPDLGDLEQYNADEIDDDASSEASTEDGEFPEPVRLSAKHRMGLQKSNAYRTLKRRVIEFIHRPHQCRVIKAIGSNAVDSDGTQLSPDRAWDLGRDISWTPVHLIRISFDDSLAFSDHIKGLIEDSLGETWDWWPLKQRKRPLRPGYMRLFWPSPYEVSSGDDHYIDITSDAAQRLQKLLHFAHNAETARHEEDTAPVLSKGANTLFQHVSAICSHAVNNLLNTGTPARPPPAHISSTASGAGSSSNHSDINSSGKQALPAQSAGLNTPGAAAPQSPNLPQPQAPTVALPPDRHVFLCVKRGSSHRFCDMQIHTMSNDGDFFQALKKNYVEARGTFLGYFSWWRYDKCDFYQVSCIQLANGKGIQLLTLSSPSQFQKYDINAGAPCSLSYPPQSRTDYDFTPRVPIPSPPAGPISAHEFRGRFYKSSQHPFGWYLDFLQRLAAPGKAKMRIRDARDAIALLPKRAKCLEMDDGKRELFWGLYARERRGFAWVLAYGLLCNIPAIIFFFLWLFRWGHGADLQNASVPLTMSISLSLFFLAMLREERGSDRG
ncbi:hypothetical protein M409DRAFT_56787 [Zasmidium cellare ATCC 36951]|uniref:Uncharacterized protein n=1 Tax=Zasmidium cellare ATCC 36951 TaxID=1080233 RepID=A0A6A6CA78_ZASCE|nr:uncharacterized protein M409DRAFT_56787 [Zasmidium cellare ATCC 36951]KAF2164064.1 hypothetical protein M409DRAFT_56787 [Zasmidium cellare ATCC 36951]